MKEVFDQINKNPQLEMQSEMEMAQRQIEKIEKKKCNEN